MKLVGITGGVCTGSSTVIEYIEEKGFSVVKKKEIWEHLHTIKGLQKNNLPVDIFVNEKLRSLVKPHVIEYIKTRQAFFRLSCKSVLFIDLPFLFECELEEYFTSTVVVTCGPKTQEERVHKKYSTDSATSAPHKSGKSLSLESIKKIIQSEMPLSEKRKKCTYVIDNNKGIENTYCQIDNLLRKFGRYSYFYAFIVVVAFTSIILPILIRYKEKTQEINVQIKAAIEKLRTKIKRLGY
ncbi:dephospho-CoA kinase [Nematocida ausubeli]|nr:dephospho-CoA kinase [Nematocida ausubeli]